MEPSPPPPATSQQPGDEAAVVAAERAQALADKAEQAVRRSRLGVRDMVLSMLLVGVVVVLVAQPWRQNAVQTPARLVPWQPVAAAFATSVDWPVLVPVPPPAGWESTSARIEPTLDGRTALHIGWITSDQQYAALEQSDTADIRYVGSKTADGAASGAPYLAGGRTWDRLVSADGATRSLVQVAEPSTGAQGRLTYVVTGSAPWSELEALASSLSPLPVRPAASPSE